MRLVVDLDKVVVVLKDAQDVDEVSVVVAAPRDATAGSAATVHRLADVLAATNVGTLGPDGTVTLRAEAVAFHAAGQVDGGWEGRFAKRCRDVGDGAVVAERAAVSWPADER